MKLLALAVLASLAMTFVARIDAQQLGPAPSGCVKDLRGKVSCPPMGGEVYFTLSGQAICGKGRCVRDPYGKVTCSAQPGGAIQQDAMGRVMCAGGCEEASEANCQQLR